MKRHDVVVVGGGVVGAATALAFVRQGFSVALVEKGAPSGKFQACPEPGRGAGEYDLRVYAIAPGSVRFLDGLGAWRAVAAARACAYQRMQVWENDPRQALAFDAAELGVAELGHIVEDRLLRASLWDALGGGAAIHAGTTVAAYEAAAGRPRLVLENGTTLEAQLVVAAEGAESRLREASGIEPGGWSYHQRSIVCNVGTERPHRACALQRFLPNGPVAFLPLADGRSSIVWSTAAAEAQDLMALDEGGFTARLFEASDAALGDITSVTPRLAFPLRLMHAQEYVRPGLALVGDSAHVIHPLAGQGMNLGLADAQALVEVAAEARAQRKPIGDLRVLQRYERRRLAANVEMMALTDGLFRLFKSRVPGVGMLRELGMALVQRAGPVKRQLAQRAMGLN
jgi:ubiquinone biosynthesis UbiH/UbiF/VisC/COQ6 family hydroxylase